MKDNSIERSSIFSIYSRTKDATNDLIDLDEKTIKDYCEFHRIWYGGSIRYDRPLDCDSL
jgi:hypothetical protein